MLFFFIFESGVLSLNFHLVVYIHLFVRKLADGMCDDSCSFSSTYERLLCDVPSGLLSV